ncbi:MAG: efflux RND transporter periplasmic adaptor subunit [Chryseolinea sp.]
MKPEYAISIIFLLILTFSCRKEADYQAMEEYYTCSMHPSVRSDKPGACPVCGMGMLKVQQKSEDAESMDSTMLTLDSEEQMLANITIDTARFTLISTQTTLTGTISADENKLTTITARIKGRIDRLFLREEGGRILKGQALYSIYSEELLADQNDYLSTLQHLDKFPGQQTTVVGLIKGGREKLLLWGMTESQIKNLETNQQSSALSTYYSTSNGFVVKQLVNEGEYTEIGKPLFQIADLSSVWVETQVYANELQYLTEQTEASITIEGLPQKPIKAKMVFENPAIEENSKISLVRFRIDNTNNMIKPGMMARVTINHHPKQALVIPKSSLLIGRMTMVWIEVMPDMFESRTVETGIENKQFVEILSGLKEGDRVVTSGAYLLNSEFILKKGANSSMGGMKM